MRKVITSFGVKVWLSAGDTRNWANRPGKRWPCSTLADNAIVVEFDSAGDLVDLTVNGGRGNQNIDGHELFALLDDFGLGRDELVRMVEKRQRAALTV